jgi:alkylation response protein AidB-like acyl-CoA dehydrogenase
MNRIFNVSKKLLPRISETEMIALRSGTVSIDRNIMENSISLFNFNKLKNTYDKDYINNDLPKIYKSIENSKVYENGIFNNDLYQEIKNTKAFSFIIDNKYNGHNFNVESQSRNLVKLASVDPALGVTIMVPNSLGPGELLQHYGTEEQKNKYLPKLVTGDYIPCFGLTGPNNGSDAAGKIDTGRVIMKDGKKCIQVNVNKRYITLAPISNLVGLAFNLEDPDNLLENGKEGITVALLEKGHPGLKQETYHNPLNAGFPNGTVKGEFLIELDQIIGGEKNCGEGWKMLMECLATGRAISLPSSALASSLVSAYGVTGYANIRKQFNIPLSKMQGVQEKLANMTYNTLLIDSALRLSNAILDSGEKPSVISAIMKQQCTERARTVLDGGMDVYAGSGICLGENNFIAKFYTAAPIGITVEGSNTLTRSLIIFGQGLNKSHPYIGSIVTNIQEDNLKDFSVNIRRMIGYTLSGYFSSLFNITSVGFPDQIHSKLNVSFTNLVNVVALMGGQLKKEQIISGHMADIFSNIYLGWALKYNFNRNNFDEKTLNICLKMLNNETLDSIEKVKNDLPFYLRLLTIGHVNTKKSKVSSKEIEYLSSIIWKNDKIKNYIEEQIVVENNILGKIKECNENYNEELYNDIIQVGENYILEK